jgi:hypothetical protein
VRALIEVVKNEWELHDVLRFVCALTKKAGKLIAVGDAKSD